MSHLDVATTIGTAAVRSGILKPMGPRAFRCILRDVRGRGANPVSVLAISAARWPQRSALIDDEGPLSYQELLVRVQVLAASLHREHGVRAGDSVGVMCRNGRGFVYAVFACASLGADVVLLNTDVNSATLGSVLRAHDIQIVLCDEEFDTALKAAEHTGTVIRPDAEIESDMRPPPAAAPGRIIMLTSGTTGTPKGVPRTPGFTQAIGVSSTVLARTRLHTGSRVVVGIPFFHGFGLAILLLALAMGATVITRRRFDAEVALAQTSLHRANAIAAVPIMLSRILELPSPVRERNPVPDLRVVVSGGSTLDPALAQRFMAVYGDVLYNGYGSSEVGIATLATPAQLRHTPETVGRPVAGTPVRILDDHNAPVPTGTTGRVFVGGSMTFDAYTGGARKPVITGLTGTGDMGYLDERGCLFIVGREDDMIVSGGENVYPQAVERALAAHPEIADNAVIGVDDAEYGQRLAVFVVVRGNSALSVDDVRNFLKDRVSRFEQPRDVHLVIELPRNPSGKVLRNQLRAT